MYCGFRIADCGYILIFQFVTQPYFLFRAVFIDDTVMDNISLHSCIKDEIESLLKISTSSITSNQTTFRLTLLQQYPF